MKICFDDSAKKRTEEEVLLFFFLDKSLEEMHLFNSESCKKSCLTNNFFPITDFFLSEFFNVFFIQFKMAKK
jgi:hypothetical protein